MADLYWFQFQPSQWFMGKIQRCDEITQARFIRLCCLYWNKQGQISKEDAEIEIDADVLKKLTDKKIVKISGGAIIIDFLDAQFESIGETTKGKSTAGTIGNLKRWYPDIYERLIAKEITLDEALKEQSHTDRKVSHTDRTPIAKRSQTVAEDRKEHKSKEKNSTVENITIEHIKEKQPVNNGDKKSPFMDGLKEFYLDWYKSEKGIDFIWSPKDDKALGQIVLKIKTLYDGQKTPADIVVQMWRQILTGMPKWNKANASEPNQINGQFNSIIQKIKTENDETSYECDFWTE